MLVRFYETGEGKKAELFICLQPDRLSSVHRHATEQDKAEYAAEYATHVASTKPPAVRKGAAEVPRAKETHLLAAN